jgi:menaquinone-dependent protoporphyrinogen IX oxidase
MHIKSTIKIAAKVVEELHKKGKEVTLKDIQHTNARLSEFLKKKWESNLMHRQYNRV